MTRVKKTRSMKRIHNVKTGSKSKLKKQLGTDRQGNKNMRGKRVLSTYEKFLLENPEAKENLKTEQIAKQKKAEKEREQQTNTEQLAAEKTATKKEKTKTLLDQLDDKKLDDLY